MYDDDDTPKDGLALCIDCTVIAVSWSSSSFLRKINVKSGLVWPILLQERKEGSLSQNQGVAGTDASTFPCYHFPFDHSCRPVIKVKAKGTASADLGLPSFLPRYSRL